MTSTQEIIIKQPHRFKKGVSGNPKGRPATGQGIKDRLAFWFETKTIKEIESLIANPKAWDKLAAVDANCCRIISESCKRSGLSASQFIWDRLLGKAAQTAEVSVTHGLAERLDRAETILLEDQSIRPAEFVVVDVAEGDKEKNNSSI